MNRPMQQNRKSGLSPMAIASVVGVWVVVIGALVFVVLVSARERHVTEWLASNAPAISAFILRDETPAPVARQPALTGVIGAPEVFRVNGIEVPEPAPAAPATPAVLKAPPVSKTSGEYDECAIWGRDTAARLNCEDHKQKVQAYIQSAQQRDGIGDEATADKKDAGAKSTDVKKDGAKKDTQKESPKSAPATRKKGTGGATSK